MITLTLGWYVAQKEGTKFPVRWLLGGMDGKVRYNAGGRHRTCSARAFERWMKKFDAQLQTRTDESSEVFL